MKTFSTKEALRQGWEMFKSDKWHIILVTFVLALVVSVKDFYKPAHFPLSLGIILSLALFALTALVQLGWTKALLKVLDGGQAEVRDLFAHTRYFWRYVGAAILYLFLPMLLIWVGLILATFVSIGTLVLAPGLPTSPVLPILFCLVVAPAFFAFLYFLLSYQFVFAIILDTDSGVRESFKRSAQLTKGVKWKLMGFSFVFVFFNIIGLLLLGVGFLVSFPVTTLAHLWIYRKLSLAV